MRTPTFSKSFFQLNSTTNQTQAYVDVEAQSIGSYVAVWTDYSTGSAKTVGRRFDDHGNALTGEVDLITGGGSTYNAIAVTSDNRPHVAVAYNGDIFEHTYNTSTLALEGSFVGVETSATNATRPAITSFSDGSVFVTYTLETTGSNYNIYGVSINSSGVAGPTVAITTDSDITDYSRLATLTTGNFVVVYESQFAGSATDHDVLFQIRKPDGTVVKGATTISGGGSGALDTTPDVAALSSGGFATVWSSGTSSTNDIMLDVYDRNGNIIHVTQTVNTTTAGYQYAPHVNALQTGHFLVEWQDSQTSTERGQEFDGNGNKIGGEFVVYSGSSFLDATATLSSGQTVAALDSSAGGDYNVVAGVLDTRENSVNHVTGHNFFGTGAADTFIVQNTSTATNVASSGGTLTLFGFSNGAVSQVGKVGADWVFDTSGDINGDGRFDIFAHHDVGASRQLFVFTSGETQIAAVTAIGNVSTNTQIVGAGDFNHDGAADLVLQTDSGATRTLNIIPVVNGVGQTQTVAAGVPTNWAVDAIGHFAGDPKADSILMHYDDAVGNRNLELLTINNGVTSAVINMGKVGNNFQIYGAADFNGDGTDDLLLVSDSGTTRSMLIAEVHNNAITAFHSAGSVGNNVTIDGLGDYNGDHVADISYHFDTGTSRTTADFEISHYEIVALRTLGATGTDWLVG